MVVLTVALVVDTGASQSVLDDDLGLGEDARGKEDEFSDVSNGEGAPPPSPGLLVHPAKRSARMPARRMRSLQLRSERKSSQAVL